MNSRTPVSQRKAARGKAALKHMYARSPTPLYIQVAEALRHRIDNGQWRAGQQISTLESLEREFQVARITVRQAVDLLVADGLLRSEQGRGTFVTDVLPAKRWLRLETSWQALIDSIRDNVIRRIPVDHPPAMPDLGEQDGTPAPEYEFMRSVQLKNGAPDSLVNLHIDRRWYERAPEAFRTRTALPVLAALAKSKISRAHQSLVIGSVDIISARLLQVPLGTPTALARCTVIDRDGVAIYVADIMYRNDCVKLHVDLLGPPAKKSRQSTRSRR